MRGRANGIAWALALACSSAGCTVVNDVDVCERNAHPEHELNRRTEGMQNLQSSDAVGAMPFGGGLVVFLSAVSASNPDRSEIRGTLIGPDGAPQPTCEQPEEFTYAEADPDGPAAQLRLAPVIAPPLTDDSAGLIAYLAQDADGNFEVWGRFVSGTGCPFQDLPPFPISQDGPTHGPNGPAVVGLAPDDFLVVWPSVPNDLTSTDGWVRARIVHADPLGAQFLPTTPQPDGLPVDLTAGGQQVVFASAVVMEPDRVLVTWQVNETAGPVLWATILNGRLETQVGPFLLGQGQEGLPMGAGLDMAFDGQQVLVVWIQRNANDIPQVWGRYLTPEGDFLTAPQAPQGGPFPVSPFEGASAAKPSVVALPEGGFVVAWEQSGSADATGSTLRAMAFAPEGGPQFNNRSCDRTAFSLNLADEGDQTWPSLAQLEGGAIVSAWTDLGFNGPDRSDGSIRAFVMEPRHLLPVE